MTTERTHVVLVGTAGESTFNMATSEAERLRADFLGEKSRGSYQAEQQAQPVLVNFQTVMIITTTPMPTPKLAPRPSQD